jgi:hypothetical protein
MKLKDFIKLIDKNTLACFAIFGTKDMKLLGRFSANDKGLEQYFNLEIELIDIDVQRYCKILLKNA